MILDEFDSEYYDHTHLFQNQVNQDVFLFQLLDLQFDMDYNQVVDNLNDKVHYLL